MNGKRAREIRRLASCLRPDLIEIEGAQRWLARWLRRHHHSTGLAASRRRRQPRRRVWGVLTDARTAEMPKMPPWYRGDLRRQPRRI